MREGTNERTYTVTKHITTLLLRSWVKRHSHLAEVLSNSSGQFLVIYYHFYWKWKFSKLILKFCFFVFWEAVKRNDVKLTQISIQIKHNNSSTLLSTQIQRRGLYLNLFGPIFREGVKHKTIKLLAYFSTNHAYFIGTIFYSKFEVNFMALYPKERWSTKRKIDCTFPHKWSTQCFFLLGDGWNVSPTKVSCSLLSLFEKTLT